MSSVRAVEVPSAPEPLRGHLPLGDSRLRVTSRYLERDGVPIIPVSAEVHFSRIPREAWDDELRKIAASGVTVLATYAIWIHHEQVEGELRFDGVLDVRAFVELCLAHGLDVFVRIGPWAHAEARNGGLPDWLLARELTPRSNDPRYLAEARRWFGALGEQLRGLDLFAVQVENELYDDPDHLATLVDLAREFGIDAPLWTGTAWGGAHLPVDRLLPLYAGYSEAFWIAHDEGFDASSASNFYYSDERDEVGVGADTRDSALTPSNLDASRYPYATCELGGGMREPGRPGATHLGPWERASAPTDFSAAGRWSIDVSELPRREGLRVLLELDWVGDIARAAVDGRVVDDRYYTGRPWMLPLPLLDDAAGGAASTVEIEIISMDPAAPIYLPALGDGAAAIRSIGVRRVERR